MKSHNDIDGKSGFTLLEIMIAIGILSMVMASILAVFIGTQRTYYSTTLKTETSQGVSFILEKMVYGPGTNVGIRAAESDSVSVIRTNNDWSITYVVPDNLTNTFTYNQNLATIRYTPPGTTNSFVIGRSLSSATITNTSEGLHIALIVSKIEGQFEATNRMSTFLKYRN